jgi:hypothetical protein
MKNISNLEPVQFTHNKKKEKRRIYSYWFENYLEMLELWISYQFAETRNAACCSTARPFYSKLYIAGPATFYSAARHHYSSEIFRVVSNVLLVLEKELVLTMADVST